MRKIRLTTVLTVIFSLLIAGSVFSQTASQAKKIPLKGQVVVQFEDDIELNTSNKMYKSFNKVSFNLPTFDAILDNHQVFEADAVFPWRTEKPAVNSGLKDLTRYYVLNFPEDVDVNSVIADLMQNSNVRYAEPVYAVKVDAAPDDPQWWQQWALHPDDVPNPNFFNAWDYETGSDSIKFALIDSGVLYKHEDLEGNVWVNPGEDLDGDGEVFDADDMNGIDDDGNGKVDDLIGWDFFSGFSGVTLHPSEDPSPPDNDPLDFNGHGTHVAGIAAACNNNGIGVASGAGGWFGGHRSTRGVQIICCRVGGSASDNGGVSYSGYVNTLNAAQAIDYCSMMGANVMNASWGSSAVSAAAAENAMTNGATFTHAAGNDNANDPDDMDFLTDIISVASVAQPNDIKSSFSNYGNWVDVAAPGSSIYSTYSFSYTPGYASLGGTSMAAPMAASVALLIRSMMPSLTRAEVDSILMATADSAALYGGGNNILYTNQLGSGRIDAEAALAGLANAKFTADVTEGSAPLDVQFTDLSPNSPVAWTWHFGDGDSSIAQNPLHTYTEAGIYDVSLIEDENHPLGPGEEHLKRYIWVTNDTLKIDSVETPISGTAVVPVYLANTSLVKEIQLPIRFTNTLGVTYSHLDVTGTRADYFAQADENAIANGVVSIILRSNTTTSPGSNYLPADTGLVVNLYFNVNATNTGVVTIDTLTFNGKSPYVKSIYGDYWPVNYTPGKINISGCCIGSTGDINGDGNPSPDLSDLLYLVDYMFASPPGSAPVCPEEADMNGDDTSADLVDLLYLVEYMFASPPGPAPVSCF